MDSLIIHSLQFALPDFWSPAQFIRSSTALAKYSFPRWSDKHVM